MKKRILLYYKYVITPEPDKIKIWQQELCKTLNLQGRILLAQEGINGTVCGSLEATQVYIHAMNSHEFFNNIDFKESIVNGLYDYFPDLQVKIKNEIVNLGINPEDLLPEHGGAHLTPEQAHELMIQKPDDLVILDGRNYYEARIGTFKDAITPPVNNFREFPDYIDQNLEKFQDKQVLMFCTGGVRCERASAYLKAKNITKNIYQITGGIHRYAEKYPDGFFRGKNYVFDARVAVSVTDDILGSCDHCTLSCDTYTNCRNAQCNKHFIACNTCLEKFNNTCSAPCYELVTTGAVKLRPYRPNVDPVIYE